MISQNHPTKPGHDLNHPVNACAHNKRKEGRKNKTSIISALSPKTMKFTTKNMLALATIWWFSSLPCALADTTSTVAGSTSNQEETLGATTFTAPVAHLRGYEAYDEDEEPTQGSEGGTKNRKRGLKPKSAKAAKVAKACKGAKKGKKGKKEKKKDLWEPITDREDEFSLFIEAVEKGRFDDDFMEESGNLLTVFVPTNEAIMAAWPLIGKYFDLNVWPSSYLGSIVNYHIVPQEFVSSKDLSIGETVLERFGPINDNIVVTADPICGLPQLNGPTIQNPASFVEVDNVANNGVYHVIDKVLTSSLLLVNVVTAAASQPDFSMFFELIQTAGLTAPTSILQGEGPVSVFGVPNQVFQAVQANLDAAGAGFNFFDVFKADPRLLDILNNHIIDGTIVCGCSPTPGGYQSVFGETLTIAETASGNFQVNGIDIVDGFFVSNAGIDVIAGFLFPPGTNTGAILGQ